MTLSGFSSMSARETFEHGGGDADPVQAVCVEGLIPSRVRQEPGWQGEGGRAGVGAGGGQRLGDSGT